MLTKEDFDAILTKYKVPIMPQLGESKKKINELMPLAGFLPLEHLTPCVFITEGHWQDYSDNNDETSGYSTLDIYYIKKELVSDINDEAAIADLYNGIQTSHAKRQNNTIEYTKTGTVDYSNPNNEETGILSNLQTGDRNLKIEDIVQLVVPS